MEKNRLSEDLDTTGAKNITVDFWYRIQNTQSGDFQLYYYDGTSYDFIANLGGSTKNVWLHYTNTITDPQYFIPNFNIQFHSQPGNNRLIWLDDVLIRTDKILFSDGFENSIWNENWTDFGQKNVEKAISYLINTLQMTNDTDEFNTLAVQFDQGGTNWLKNKVVWPQPGYYVPPFIKDPHFGWVRNVSTWQDFAYSLKQSFGNIYNTKLPVETSIKTVAFTDPKLANNERTVLISVVPKGS